MCYTFIHINKLNDGYLWFSATSYLMVYYTFYNNNINQLTFGFAFRQFLKYIHSIFHGFLILYFCFNVNKLI